MIVTIDGPAGAGKSSAARQLAKRLGFRFLDTGAMYRSVTLAATRNQIDWDNSEALARLVETIDLQISDDRVLLDGEDVTEAIRTFEITSQTRHAADNRAVREWMVRRQREIASNQDFVTEGRDQATVVFPDAECKIYLTAGEEVRAKRRYQDLVSRGEQVSLAEVLEKQQQRDKRDLQREFGGLRKAADSIEVPTDGLTP
ncbi:MAG: (d)CMP kinase, partial [Planctomycetales bacterium]|nr:(d)CMP kinase [Planctomycetales bacterium]